MHTRFSLRGERGTVQWRGSIEDATWLGIAWDDSRRGKHNGVYQGAQLFTCQPGTGSFLRESKFKPDPTVCLSRALREKYQEAGNLLAETSVAGVDRAAQQVGFRRAQERYSDVQALKLVSLEARCIDALDKVDLPCCEDLDLSCNLINDLDCVARLCLTLPSLKCLRLANRFHQLQTREATIDSLHLGDTMLSWDNILMLCTRWHVRHLYLEHNGLQDPAADFKTAPEVQTVELAGNCITNVHSITRVFPSLESLSLSGNQVAAVSSLTLSHPLQRLALQDNPLPVDALSALPYQLIELSMTQLADPDADLARRLEILKHLPSLQVLNKTRITAQERQDALAVAAPKREAMLLAHDVLNLTLAWEEDMVEVRVLKSQTVLQMRNLVKHVCGLRPLCTLQDDATLDSLGLESGGKLLFHIHGSG